VRSFVIALLACSCALLPAAAVAGDVADTTGDEAAPRFQLSGKVVPSARDAGGRFAIQAQARYTPERKPGSGRFSIKSTAATDAECATANLVFQDSFEDAP
jgi:hypothetical protein